jgi:hypothetical protein
LALIWAPWGHPFRDGFRDPWDINSEWKNDI